MLRFTLWFISILLVMAITLYATLPFWFSQYLAKYNPPGWSVHNIDVGYPSLNTWSIHHLEMSPIDGDYTKPFNNTNTTTSPFLQARDIKLSYNLKDLWQKQHYQLEVGSVLLNQDESSTVSPIVNLLQPSKWIGSLPEQTTIKHIKGDLPQNFLSDPQYAPSWYTQLMNMSKNQYTIGKERPSEQYDLSANLQTDSITWQGQINATPTHVSLVAKVDHPSGLVVYIDSQFNKDDTISITFYNQDKSLSIGKLTSQFITRTTDYLWKGNGRVNAAYLIPWLPKRSDLLDNLQGKIGSRWQVSLPSDSAFNSNKNSQANNDAKTLNWLEQWQGEHNIELELINQNQHLHNYELTANLTHKFAPDTTNTWAINSGSQLRYTPPWQRFELPVVLSESHQLTDTALDILVADTSTIDVTSDLTWRFKGLFNIQTRSKDPKVKLYGQIKNVAFNPSMASVMGEGSVRAFIDWPKASNGLQEPLSPLMFISLQPQSLEFKGDLKFAVKPNHWHVKLLSGTQSVLKPISQVDLMASSLATDKTKPIRLFASPELLISNEKPISLNFYPLNNYWQWEEVNVSITPQPIVLKVNSPNQAQATKQQEVLNLTLSKGHTRFSNVPAEGTYQLESYSSQLSEGASSHLKGKGKFMLDKQAIGLDFNGSAASLAEKVSARIRWDLLTKNLDFKTQTSVGNDHMQPKLAN